MLNWFYQLVLSFITRVLSWFGLSFGKEIQEALEVAEAVETIQTAGAAGKSDDIPASEPAIEAYSSASSLAPVAE